MTDGGIGKCQGEGIVGAGDEVVGGVGRRGIVRDGGYDPVEASERAGGGVIVGLVGEAGPSCWVGGASCADGGEKSFEGVGSEREGLVGW